MAHLTRGRGGSPYPTPTPPPGRRGVHPCNVSINGFFSDHLEQINSMNSAHWGPVLVNDEDMVPIVFGENIKHRGHRITSQQGMWMLHNVSTQHLSHFFSYRGGLVGLAKKRSGCHGFSTAPVSPPFLNPSEKPPLISGIRKLWALKRRRTPQEI